MTIDDDRQAPAPGPWAPGWKTMVSVSAFYLACLFVATYPAMTTMSTTVPSLVDPVVHLWTMRWNKACLLQGRLPFFCPEIQYPVGAALGTLPPMHFQTLLFVPLSLALGNDILCYNLIRTFAFCLTGVGTFVLAWNVTRSRAAACLAGLTAMLSTPMTYFSHGELEQITLGWFPLFLLAWMRWVDRPSGRGLVASASLYTLVAMSAPYFGVFAIFPAVFYVAWRGIGAGRSGISAWAMARLRWFAAFAAITGPMLLVLFSNQLWAIAHGYVMSRPDSEFWNFRAPFWGYLVPLPFQLLGRLLPTGTNTIAEVGTLPSYLGVVSLALLAYAAAFRVRFARASFWWGLFALLVVLSLGAHAWVGPYDVPLPALWLRKYFIGFRMIRVPARFNLFAAVGGAIVVAAAFKHLLDRLPSRALRAATLGACSAVVVADLATVPYHSVAIPPMPACYRAILDRDPQATFLDTPQFNSAPFGLAAICTLWQSEHGGTTTAGHTAFLNFEYDNLLCWNSPFQPFQLSRPDYLDDPRSEDFELVRGVDFRDYAWLYLTVHQLRYVVVHHRPGAFHEMPVRLDRLEAALADAKVYEDADAAVYDRDLLPPPGRPTLVYAEGWGHRLPRRTGLNCKVGASGKVFVYNPDPDRPLRMTLDASGHRAARAVRLVGEAGELARWQVAPKDPVARQTPPFRLRRGLQALTLESDGASPPAPNAARIEGDNAPFSLWVQGIGIAPEADDALAARPDSPERP